jgi:predicted lipid-binding transport protein (Tim44 family)
MRHPQRRDREVLLQLRPVAGAGGSAARGSSRLSVEVGAPSLPPLPAVASERQAAIEAGFGAITASDPGFDRFRLFEQAKSRFVTVKQALAAWQPESCRSFMIPQLYESWSAQVTALRDSRVRNVFDDLQVGDPQAVWVNAGPDLEHITVQINAMSLHYAFNEGSRELLFGDDNVMRAFSEYWTFSRPAARHTSETALASCPVCGAPVQPGDLVCRYCRNALPLPAAEWLVSRMDDEVVWRED